MQARSLVRLKVVPEVEEEEKEEEEEEVEVRLGPRLSRHKLPQTREGVFPLEEAAAGVGARWKAKATTTERREGGVLRSRCARKPLSRSYLN